MEKWRGIVCAIVMILLLGMVFSDTSFATESRICLSEEVGGAEREFMTPDENGRYSYEYKGAKADCMYVLLAVTGLYDSWDDVEIRGLEDKILYIDQKTAGEEGVVFDKFIPMKKEDATVFIKGGDKTVHLAGYLKGGSEELTEPEERVAAPVADPAGGEVGKGTVVKLFSATEGAGIYYTMGNVPAIPTVQSTAYDASEGIIINEATVINAVAVREGMKDSEVSTFTYLVKADKDNYSTYPDDRREDIGDCVIADIRQSVYNGKPYLPTPKVTLMVNGVKKTLVPGTDYRLAYSDNLQAGTGTVHVIGIGSCRGSKRADFVIKPKEIGKLVKIVSCVAAEDAGAEPVALFDGVKTLIKGADYDYQIMASDVKEKNTFRLRITGMGNYGGSCTVKVPVIEKGGRTVIGAADVVLQKGDYEYSGKPIKPEVTVRVNGKDIEKGKDYSITYKNNKNAGMACVVVSGRGKSYTGKAVKFFAIRPEKSGKFSRTGINKAKNLIYTGKQHKPSVSVWAQGKKLVLNRDYTVEYKDNLIAGKGLVEIAGVGNYEGFFAEESFVIGRQDIRKASVKVKGAADYTLKYNGIVLKEGFDYKVVSDSAADDTVTLTFEGLGNFQGVVTKKGVKKVAGGR